jgi:hypothetical protein
MATGAIIAMAAIAAVGALQQGQASKNEADFAAEVDKQQADRERQVAEATAQDFRRRQGRSQADRRAGQGASGIRPGTGSDLLAQGDFAQEVELQALRIAEGGEVRATRLEQRADLRRRAGANAQKQGFFRAGSSLLSGAGTAFG